MRKFSLSRTFRPFSPLKKGEKKKNSKVRIGGENKKVFVLKVPTNFEGSKIAEAGNSQLKILQKTLPHCGGKKK